MFFTFLLCFANVSVFYFLSSCALAVYGLPVWSPSVLLLPSFDCVFSSGVVLVVGVLVSFNRCLSLPGLFSCGYTVLLLTFLVLCSMVLDDSMKFVGGVLVCVDYGLVGWLCCLFGSFRGRHSFAYLFFCRLKFPILLLCRF